MANKIEKMAVLEILRQSDQALSLPDIQAELIRLGLRERQSQPAERTLRRWLVAWVADGQLIRSGQKRGTRYQSAFPVSLKYEVRSPDGVYAVAHLKFLDEVPKHRRADLLTALRDLWTHSSTALEGNTLSLGDTHFLLEEGLTVGGKSLKDHQEVIGHARAIELIYQRLHSDNTENKLIDKDFIFALHKAVQAEHVIDIYKPQGAWKVEPNGVYATNAQGKQIFIEFTKPQEVDTLMKVWIASVNQLIKQPLLLQTAPDVYARVHISFTQIHPFWDGNGRLARLLANVILLKAGLPPLVVNQERRQEYIKILSAYSLQAGQLTIDTDLYPLKAKQEMKAFTQFCRSNYRLVTDLIEEAMT